MYKLNDIYKQESYFQVVSDFNQNFRITVNDDNFYFYKDVNQLKSELSSFNEFYFNPAIKYLFTYPKLASFRESEIRKKYKKKLINAEKQPSLWLVQANDIEEALLLGSGIIAVYKNSIEKYEYHSLRLFSIEDNIVGSLPPIKFNLFFNTCKYCEGYEKITSYSTNVLMLDSEKSPLNSKYIYNKHLVVPKLVMKAFTSQGIFDFDKPLNELSNFELNQYFYGIKGLGLPIRKSKPNERHYWEGLNHYIYNNRNKLKTKIKALDLQDFGDIDCNFCQSGYLNEIKYYLCEEKNIVETLKSNLK